MTDDHAAHAISAYGSRVNKTPHIDLAREGALLSNVFATNSICTPSRAAILTGQYSHLNGVTMFNRFDSARMTVARLPQQSGYHTGMIGKWHLGSDPAGFDRWEILRARAHTGILCSTRRQERRRIRAATPPMSLPIWPSSSSSRAAREAVLSDDASQSAAPSLGAERSARGQLREATVSGAGDALGLHATRTDALHENQQRVAADLTNRDPGLPPPAGLAGPELTKWLAIKPDSVTIERDGKSVTLTSEALVRWKYQRYMQDYLATVQSVDDSVGRMLDALDKSGLAKDTVVIYTSDRDSSSATTASSTNDSCTRSRSGCRFSFAGPRDQARNQERVHGAQHRLRTHIPRAGRSAGLT